MRPLFHPAIAELSVSAILHALSDPVRLYIYAELDAAKEPRGCLVYTEYEGRTIPKSTLSHHFNTLREAGLIRSERKGQELLNASRRSELDGPLGDLVDSVVSAYQWSQAK